MNTSQLMKLIVPWQDISAVTQHRFNTSSQCHLRLFISYKNTLGINQVSDGRAMKYFFLFNFKYFIYNICDIMTTAFYYLCAFVNHFPMSYCFN